MTRLALCLLLLATGASAERLTEDIEVVHDQKRGVTCWVPRNGYNTHASDLLHPRQPTAGRQRAPTLPARNPTRTYTRSGA